ncbi:hypothetical protein [Edaphobacter flagellatus]|uniref:hypothetical protein n=1 Tax=Edaphobacter flagellatus TaxID=1933044 RepID=UPI0021B3E798|nr:hypothetical protein [Edaphobacter flagellatus]
MTQRDRKIAGLVHDLRAVLDGRRVVTLMASSGELSMVVAVEDAIQHCVRTAKSTYDASIADHKSEIDAKTEAAEAYVFALPELNNVASVRCFIAAVAAGVRRGFIPGQQARLLLYTAQLQLAAMTRKVVA